jgi:uncharacterized protein (DUF885 family)
MEGYFSIKVKFVLSVLLAVLLYVSYLYIFKEQTPALFKLSKDCTADQIKEGTATANSFFERYFEERVLRDPEWQSRLDRKEKNDEWTSMTEGYYRSEHYYNQAMLRYLEDSILLSLCLEEPTRLSARLLKSKFQLELEAYAYQYHNYPINSVNGVHLDLVSVLINEHEIEDLRDAEAYVSRIQKVEGKINQLIAQLTTRSEKQFILPKFLFPDILQSINKIMKNQVDEPNLIVSNFNEKIEKLRIGEEVKEVLKKNLLEAFDTIFVPSYQNLYKYLVDLEKNATNEIGAWRWELGADFYAFKLKEQTTTSLTAAEIYNLGIEEVARIQAEMREIIKKLNYEGDLQAFFKFLQNDASLYYPNTSKGKQAYMDRLGACLDSIQTKLVASFSTKFNREITIKPLESINSEFTLKSIFSKTILRNNKSGIYAVDTDDMEKMPKYMMDAMIYQEVLPGRYLQLEKEASLTHLPEFRRLENSYPAYIEGWGMYAGYLSKEMGAYQDAYSDFGRLTLELWSACQLVVDVGIHEKKWTKEAAINYYKENTHSLESECLKMVERQIVLPAQATAHKIGMITILELRKRAELELGSQFDLREFHEILLTNGKVPLDVLQDLVEDYIQTKKG